MGIIKLPLPVKLFFGLISAKKDIFNMVIEEIKKIYGEFDMVSDFFQFGHTHYYDKEFGQDLMRKFIFIKKLIHPEEIIDIKLKTNQIEQRYTREDAPCKRMINIDPGYITDSKLILATTKDYSHRIYLNKGIFAEITLRYKRQSGWGTFDWTYPDFQTGEIRELMEQARAIYMDQRKKYLDFRG